MYTQAFSYTNQVRPLNSISYGSDNENQQSIMSETPERRKLRNLVPKVQSVMGKRRTIYGSRADQVSNGSVYSSVDNRDAFRKVR